MLHASSNRGTPTSGDNITKLVRQNYKPSKVEPYIHEQVQCRTEQNLRKNKPDDYWTSNFYRRQANFQRGFYSVPTEPYKPIGGHLYLDPYELVVSALPGNVDIKVAPRITRRGTIHEEELSKKGEKLEKPTYESATSLDSNDLYESAGFDDIKKLLKESKQRMISVRAGMPYEEHVKLIEEQNQLELSSSKPEDTGMTLHSVSSMFLPTQLNKSPTPGTSRQSSPRSVFSPREEKGVMIADLVKSPSPVRRFSRARPSLRPPSLKKSNKLSLIQVSSGLTSVINRKERLFRDHYLYLKCIYNILTALHNMKVRDIRSKVPLSKDVVERLQKEQQSREEEGKTSRGTYGNRFHPKRPRPRRFSVCESDPDFHKEDSPHQKKPQHSWMKNTNPTGRHFGRSNNVSSVHMDEPPPETHMMPRMSIFGTMKKINTVDAATKNVFGRRKVAKKPRGDNPNEKYGKDSHENDGLSVFHTVKKIQTLDTINKNFLNLARRKSRNATCMGDKPALETWEDLLNVQPEQYKEEHQGGNIALQFGVVAKFMRWYRRASIIPMHSNAAAAPLLDKSQITHLQDIAEDRIDRPEKRESVFTQHQGSVIQQTEKVRKLTIWQQVAQEKSTVFENKQKAPDSENVIKRFERNLNKLKRSVQKENTAEIEKMVRERVANFRLKFGTLSNEQCSPLFEEQKLKMLDVKENVNKIHLENFDIQPSKWYEELRDKTKAIISSYSQPSLMEMLTKLQTYSRMDNKTVSYAKPKLCLLMMSLPAYDICQIHMQRALKFVFENILLGQEAQYQEWLNHRKIPNVVVKDP